MFFFCKITISLDTTLIKTPYLTQEVLGKTGVSLHYKIVPDLLTCGASIVSQISFFLLLHLSVQTYEMYHLVL